VLQALMFFPRGGSATVARALARELPARGWESTILSGSLPGYGDAERFYAGLDVHAARFEPAGDVPMHPSYEDRRDAPDRVFAAIDDEGCERHVAAWAELLDEAGAASADVLHLHHLTPINEAAARVAPDVPIVGHLHGTELLMLETIAEGRAPATWVHADAWAQRMREWAGACRRIILLSPTQRARTRDLLGVAPERCVVLPNGFDPRTFDRRPVDRRARWHDALVAHPKGWAPDRPEGSIAYAPADAEHVAASAVVLYVGRFTSVKRVGLLIRAWQRAEARFERPGSLVILGGHPGEWEDEHPADVIDATGARHVYLAGWRLHEELPEFLNAADVVVLPSVREQFGAVLVEGMACGRPAIAVDRYGPAEIVDDGETGWLVEPDDEEALAAALVHAVNDPDERDRRGRAAYAVARRRYGWPSIAARLGDLLDEAAAGDASNGLALAGS
jgi:glycosyltransferase involved in cell wall biosynthesis